MLAGAMFFGREATGDGGSELQIGPVLIGTKALYISIVSALIVMPVNIAIALLFKRSRPKPEPADRSVHPSGRHECFCRRLWRRLTCNQEEATSSSGSGAIRQSRVQIIGAAPDLLDREPGAYSHSGFGSQCSLPNSAFSADGHIVTRNAIVSAAKAEEELQTGGSQEGTLGQRVLQKMKRLVFFWRKQEAADASSADKKKEPFSLPYWTVYIAWARMHTRSTLKFPLNVFVIKK